MQKFVEEKMAKVAPVPCDFMLGDTVTVTNGYGVEIQGKKVIGFVLEICEFRPGAILFLDWDCYWFPVAPDKLKHESRDVAL